MPRKPNLLFIFSDQQRYDSLPSYGADWVKAPNLERLASESFVFENAYVSQPVCTPSRSTIMTGLNPHANGCTVNNIPLQPDALTIAEMVDDEYVCGNYGRWHLGDDVAPQHGFEEWMIHEDSWRPFCTRPEYLDLHSNFHRHLEELGYEPDNEIVGGPVFSHEFHSKLPAEHQVSTYLADAAIRFIESRQTPFMLYVSFHDPHEPYTGPFDDMYDPQSFPVGPAFRKRGDAEPLVVRMKADRDMRREIDGFDVSNEEGWRAIRARYYGKVSFMDRAVGRILSALDRSGMADETIVVFTSEHGDMLGDHFLHAKRFLYEPSARVPLLMRVPWLGRKRRDVGGNHSHVDLVPTLLDLLGQPVPEHLQGRSRVPVLKGEATVEDNYVVVEHHGVGDIDLGSPDINLMNAVPWRSIVSADRWKLNLTAGDQCGLYDLEADPGELVNLYGRREHRDRVRLMAARLSEWQCETGDATPLPDMG